MLARITEDDLWHGSKGICLSCGQITDGVEPDAEHYKCEYCEKYEVFGAEQALLLGMVEVIDG